MHWKLWRAGEKFFNSSAWIFAGPAVAFMVLADFPIAAAEWCKRKKWQARSQTVTQISPPAGFVKAEEIERG